MVEPSNVGSVGVVRSGCWLVGLAEPHEVGGDHAVALGHEAGNHVAVEVGPGRFAVKEEHRLVRISWSLVDVVDPEGAAIS